MKAAILLITFFLGLSISATAQDGKIKSKNAIIHTVLFKFIPNTSREQINNLTSEILRLKSTMPSIELVSYGENFSERSFGFTYIITITFRDKASLVTFYGNPEHKKLIKDLIIPIKAEMLVIDYEDQAKY